MSKKKDIKDKMCELIKACILYGGDDKDDKITKTKLAKLVYLSDFVFYYYNFKPITGEVYHKLDYGPVAKGSYFKCLKLLEKKEKIESTKKGKSVLISSLKKDVKINLDKKELEIVKKICSKWKNKKTGEIKEFTHNQIPWKISFENDEIPYSLIIQENEMQLY